MTERMRNQSLLDILIAKDHIGTQLMGSTTTEGLIHNEVRCPALITHLPDGLSDGIDDHRFHTIDLSTGPHPDRR